MSRVHQLAQPDHPPILFISPYLGPLPPWLTATLRTMADNTSFRWLIPSDQPPPAELARVPNVRWLPTTSVEYMARVQSVLGAFEIVPWKAYKIVDFKPILGPMFHDHTAGYEFWGHTDLDIFFGDLAKFITAETCERYDIMGSHKGRICGQFNLYRNTPVSNELWRSAPAIAEQMKDLGNHRFVDEAAFSDAVAAAAEQGRVRWGARIARHGYPEDRWAYEFRDGRVVVRPGGDRWKVRARMQSAERMFYHFRTWKPRTPFDPFAVSGWTIEKNECKPLV